LASESGAGALAAMSSRWWAPQAADTTADVRKPVRVLLEASGRGAHKLARALESVVCSGIVFVHLYGGGHGG
jgi:hypothetical protein